MRVSSARITRKIFGTLRNFLPHQLFNRQRKGPVVCQRAEVIQPIRIRHRSQVVTALCNLFVIAMQVAKYRLQANHALAVQRNIHAEDAVRRRMMRAHGHFKQLALAIRLNHRRPIPALQPLGSCRARESVFQQKKCCSWLPPACRSRFGLVLLRALQNLIVRRRLVFEIVGLNVVAAHRDDL